MNAWTRTPLYQALAAVHGGSIDAKDITPAELAGLEALKLAKEFCWNDGNLSGRLTSTGASLLTLLEGVK